jgi:hypothetical protein
MALPDKIVRNRFLSSARLRGAILTAMVAAMPSVAHGQFVKVLPPQLFPHKEGVSFVAPRTGVSYSRTLGGAAQGGEVDVFAPTADSSLAINMFGFLGRKGNVTSLQGAISKDLPGVLGKATTGISIVVPTTPEGRGLAVAALTQAIGTAGSAFRLAPQITYSGMTPLRGENPRLEAVLQKAISAGRFNLRFRLGGGVGKNSDRGSGDLDFTVTVLEGGKKPHWRFDVGGKQVIGDRGLGGPYPRNLGRAIGGARVLLGDDHRFIGLEYKGRQGAGNEFKVSAGISPKARERPVERK